MCHYLERFGGFGGHRETGYIMWCLAHVADCLVQQDVRGAQEFLALTLVALDQSVIGRNRCLLVVSFVLLCLVMFCPLSFLKYDSLGGIEWNLLSTEWVAVKGFF